jgi:hypothetical protein
MKILIAFFGALILTSPISASALTFTVSGTIVSAEYDEPIQNENNAPITDLKDTQVLYQLGSGPIIICVTTPASSPTGGAHVRVDCNVPVLPGQESDVTFTAVAHDLTDNVSVPSIPVIKRIDRLAPKQIE